MYGVLAAVAIGYGRLLGRATCREWCLATAAYTAALSARHTVLALRLNDRAWSQPQLHWFVDRDLAT